MGFAIKAVVIFVLLGVAFVAGYAYFGDMSADAVQTQVPVELDATK